MFKIGEWFQLCFVYWEWLELGAKVYYLRYWEVRSHNRGQSPPHLVDGRESAVGLEQQETT